MKAFLPLLIVLLHTSGHYEAGTADYWLRVALSCPGQIAVPIFFFISGCLFFYGMNELEFRTWLYKVKKRGRTLLLPYVLWCIIAIIYVYTFTTLKCQEQSFGWESLKEYIHNSINWHTFYDCLSIGSNENIFGYSMPHTTPLNGPIWYIRDLMVLIMLSPIIYILLKWSKGWILFLYAISFVLDAGIPVSGFSTDGFFFFSAGAAFSINGISFTDLFRKYKITALSIFIIGVILYFTISGIKPAFKYEGSRLLIICASVIFIIIIDKLAKVDIPTSVRFLSDVSFFVYALHLVGVTEFTNFVLWRVMPFDYAPVLILKVFLRPILTIAICLVTFWCLKKVIPRTLGLLCGGRI